MLCNRCDAHISSYEGKIQREGLLPSQLVLTVMVVVPSTILVNFLLNDSTNGFTNRIKNSEKELYQFLKRPSSIFV